MKLKRFTAADTRSAMQKIKTVFGPDAVILSSTRVEDGVEVVAAVDFDETMLATEIASASAEPVSKQKDQTGGNPLDEMRQEISTLRGMLEAQIRGHHAAGMPLHSLLMQKLMYTGMSLSSAQNVVQEVNPSLNKYKAWQYVIQRCGEQLSIRDSHRMEEGGIYAFVGATGVGKTTTLAKIAARFVLRHGAGQLGLVTMDTYRIAAQEQLMLYGKIFGVPVSVAHDEASLLRVIRQLGDKKLILIDTAGMNPNDNRVNNQMHLLSTSINSIMNVLVLPATSYYQVLRESVEGYGVNHIDQCIITKLDESRALGGVLSILMEYGIAASYLTHGQRVPEDIKLATRHQLMEQFMEQERCIEAQYSGSHTGLQIAGSAYSYE